MNLVYELLRLTPITLAAQAELTTSVLRCCIAALQTQERVALQRACLVTTSLIHEAGVDAPYTAAFRPLLLANGRDIVGTILLGIGGSVPRSSVPALSEVLHALVFRLPSQTRLWLGELCSQDRFPSDRLDADTKTQFVQAVVASRALKKVKTACDQLAIVARGLGAYGSATVL